MTQPTGQVPRDQTFGKILGLSCVIWALMALCILPELTLQGADLGLWGTALWRPLVYQNGAFWPGLLGDWQANYPFQTPLMFVTYGFLHAGLWHMCLNMVTLVSLGRTLVDRLGQARFLALYLVSMLGGAAFFALSSSGSAPMVGASGALFGLAGAIVFELWWDTRSWRALFGPVAGLIALNVVMYFVMHGLLAWETHLGGFLAGAAVMALFLINQARVQD